MRTNDSLVQYSIPVQYCDIMRFMALHNRHHKVSQSVSFFMHRKTVTLLLRIRASIPVQYCDIMRFMVLHNRHHKVSQSVSFFLHRKTVTILLRIRARGHFVMSITKTHESHYVEVLDNPLYFCSFIVIIYC